MFWCYFMVRYPQPLRSPLYMLILRYCICHLQASSCVYIIAALHQEPLIVFKVQSSSFCVVLFFEYWFCLSILSFPGIIRQILLLNFAGFILVYFHFIYFVFVILSLKSFYILTPRIRQFVSIELAWMTRSVEI